MILANGNVDEKSYPKVDPVWLMDLLGDLSPINLYISLVARDEEIKTLVRKTKMGFFLGSYCPMLKYLPPQTPKHSSLTPCSMNSIVWSVTKNCWM